MNPQALPALLSLLAWLLGAALLFAGAALSALPPTGWFVLLLLVAALLGLGLWRAWGWALNLALLAWTFLVVFALEFLYPRPLPLPFAAAAWCCGLAGWNLARLALALRSFQPEAVDKRAIRSHLLRLGALLAAGLLLALFSAGLGLHLDFDLSLLLALASFAALAWLLQRA